MALGRNILFFMHVYSKCIAIISMDLYSKVDTMFYVITDKFAISILIWHFLTLNRKRAVCETTWILSCMIIL